MHHSACNALPGRLCVLYSFPHRLGAGRICYTAWQQVNGLAAAGADVLVFAGSLAKPVHPRATVVPTLSVGGFRAPYRVLRRRAFVLHDWVVARRLQRLADRVDIVHLWPSGALRTIEAAASLGIPTVLERPNAHTRFAYEVVQQECGRLGIVLPPGYEHSYDEKVLKIEEEEFQLADYLLCPSDFVARTFRERGFSPAKLLRHQYGFDSGAFFPRPAPNPVQGLKMLFVGLCAVRKGLHYALRAWLDSPACEHGTFMIAGDFLPAYRAKLGPMLSHPSIQVLGHRSDVPELMRQSDLLVLPSIEEGFGLVIAEAMACGCVPLASDACTEICQHMQTGLVHRVGDVKSLTEQITLLNDNRQLLCRLRSECLHRAPGLTWAEAGRKLLEVYQQVLSNWRSDGRARAV